MAKKISYDNIVVIKVETTCWDGPRPEGEESEIIEIGLSLLNLKSTRIHSKKQFLIRPKVSCVSDYCRHKTGLTNEVLKERGREFKDVCNQLKTIYKTTKRPWAAFGESERKIIEKQCREWSEPFPFTSRFINIRMMVPVIFGINRELTLGEAMLATNVEPEETREAGVEEAWNCAKILKEVIVGGVASSY